MPDSIDKRLGGVEHQLDRMEGVSGRAMERLDKLSAAVEGLAVRASTVERQWAEVMIVGDNVRRLAGDVERLRSAFEKALDGIAEKAKDTTKRVEEARAVAVDIRNSQGAALQVTEHLARARDVAKGVADLYVRIAGGMGDTLAMIEAARQAYAKPPSSGRDFLAEAEDDG